jgi:hypothetical protein
MKRFSVFLCLIFTIFLCLSGISTASADVRYTYTGDNFVVVTGDYTTSMSISGWIEMNDPIPPNTPLTDFSDSITSYSFFDGIITLDSNNSVIISPLAQLQTDADGNIELFELLPAAPFPATLNELASLMIIADDINRTITGDCSEIAWDICITFFNAQLGDIRGEGPFGVWERSIIVESIPVPAMNKWGMIIFILLAGISSIYFLRRKKVTR